MKYGLIIQGPRFSMGSGPNNAQSKDGFDTLDTVKENILRLKDKVELVVLSTWHKSGFEASNIGSHATLLESYPPLGFDFLNQKKQFFSMSIGANYISCNSNCTHVIKIRTDQLLPVEFIDWLDSFFTAETLDTKKIICSEMLRDQVFYVGDFVFAGSIEQICSFASNVLRYDCQRLALNNSVDYVLKHLVQSDEKVAKVFERSSLVRNQLVFFSRQAEIIGLWHDVSREYFSVLPEDIYKKIHWRGRLMSDVFANNRQAFIFYKEWQALNGLIDSQALMVSARVHVFTLFRKTYVELKRYVKAHLKFRSTSK